jgi:hypothetical protein
MRRVSRLVESELLGCHNSRVKQPPDDPVNLESANTADLLPNAAAWGVVRKLGVRDASGITASVGA